MKVLQYNQQEKKNKKKKMRKERFLNQKSDGMWAGQIQAVVRNKSSA